MTEIRTAISQQKSRCILFILGYLFIRVVDINQVISILKE